MYDNNNKRNPGLYWLPWMWVGDVVISISSEWVESAFISVDCFSVGFVWDEDGVCGKPNDVEALGVEEVVVVAEHV